MRLRFLAPVPAALIAVLALISACSEAPGPSPANGSSTASGLERLLLRPVASAGSDEVSQSVRRLDVPRELEPWTVRTGDFRVDAREDFVRLVIGPRGQRELSIPGPFDPASFDRVRLHLIGEGCRFRVRLLRAGKLMARTPSQALRLGREAAYLDFDFPNLDRFGQPFDELRIDVQGEATSVLSGIELRREPSWTPLPDPFGPPREVVVAGDRRPARALTSELPFQAFLDVPERGRLGFSYAWPEQVHAGGRAPQLVVTLDPGASERTETFQLDPENAEAWSWAVLELDDLAGETDVEVRFELVVPGEGFGLCALGVPQLFQATAGETPATVLVVTSDTHRGTYLGSVDSGIEIDTPNLDALAERGLLFTDCRSSTNVTLPSHSALFTGLPARDVGVYSNHGALSDAALTLSETFSSQGFATFASTSNWSLLGWNGLGQGFDRSACKPLVGSVADAEQTIDTLIEWLPEAEERPLFVWLHFFDAHHPYAPPRSHDRMYYPGDRDPFDPQLPDPGVHPKLLPPDLQRVRDLEFPEAQYRAEITYLDEQLARILDLPRFREGLVAFTSDHGELFGEGNVWFSHAALFPGNLHVPLILAGPGVKSGRVARTVHQIDVGRTVLDLAGLGDTSFPGRNVLEVATVPVTGPEPQFAVAADAISAAVTEGRWHLILALAPDRSTPAEPWKRHEYRLYDLETDPRCRTDVAAAEPDRVAELHPLLVEWLHGVRTESWAEVVDLSDAAIEHLAQLGYTEPTESTGETTRELYPKSCACEFCQDLPGS